MVAFILFYFNSFIIVFGCAFSFLFGTCSFYFLEMRLANSEHMLVLDPRVVSLVRSAISPVTSKRSHFLIF